MAATATTEGIVRTLREINIRLRIIEEALGIAYGDEGIFDPEVVKELKKRATEGSFISEGRILFIHSRLYVDSSRFSTLTIRTSFFPSRTT